MPKKKSRKKPAGGRPPLPPEQRRYRISVRLPVPLQRDLLELVGQGELNTFTDVVEELLRDGVARRAETA